MVQVHTVYELTGWRNKVDGLQQGWTHESWSSAVAAGRVIAEELSASHYVHDLDGRVIDEEAFGRRDDGMPMPPTVYTV